MITRYQLALVGCAFVLAGCSSTIGIGVPLGRTGNIGVSVNSDGQLGVGIGMGVGPARVNVGTSGRLPERKSSTAPDTPTQGQ